MFDVQEARGSIKSSHGDFLDCSTMVSSNHRRNYSGDDISITDPAGTDP